MYPPKAGYFRCVHLPRKRSGESCLQAWQGRATAYRQGWQLAVHSNRKDTQKSAKRMATCSARAFRLCRDADSRDGASVLRLLQLTVYSHLRESRIEAHLQIVRITQRFSRRELDSD